MKRVLLIDDHPMVSRGVRDLLSHADDFEVVGESATGAQAVEAATAARRLDLIVLDLRVGDELACDLCEPLMQAAPGAAVVIFTAFDDRPLIDACRRRGVRGVLLKDAYGIDLVKAFRSACEGRTVIDPRLQDQDGATAAGAGSPDSLDRLTEREHQVLRLLSRGLTAREIAAEMNLAVNTVRSYTQEVFSKLQVGNRVQAVAAGRRLRLL